MIEMLRFKIIVAFLLQIENRNGGLVYVVDFKEKMIDATPVDVATAIYKQMKGYILVFTFLRFTVYFSLEIADKIHTNQFMHTLLYISEQYSTGHDLFLNL